ncbi:MAG TPA: tyrosine-type recombinase/integrase, partial [Flavobacterium sp.]|nr:tyrosine-type recombinase/integrase [Flavobacterium sp.]
GLVAVPDQYYLFSRNLLPGEEKVRPRAFQERFRKIMKQMKLSYRLYDFRHTGAGMMLENKANLYDISRQLGHSSLETTEIYLKKWNNKPSEALRACFPVI